MKRKLTVFTFLLVFLSLTIPLASAATAFTDGFEATGSAWDDKWDGNGATSWVQGSGTPTPHGGTYDAHTLNGNEGDLTSDDIDLSGSSAASLSFWYYLGTGADAADLILYLYDGSVYDSIGNFGGGTEGVWTEYSISSLNSQYFISTFRVRITSNEGSGEENWIDDVLVTKTTTTAYLAEFTQSVTTSFNILTQTNFYTIHSLTTSTTWSIDLTHTLWYVNPTVGPAWQVSDAWKISPAWEYLTPINHVADLSAAIAWLSSFIVQWNLWALFSQALGFAWNFLVQWFANLQLAYTLTTTWNVLLQWVTTANLSYSLTTTWNILIQSVFSTTHSLAAMFAFTVELFLINAPVQYLAEFTLALSTSWTTLTQTVFHTVSTLTASFSIAVDVILTPWSGIAYTVELTLGIVSAWSMTWVHSVFDAFTATGDAVALAALAFIFAIAGIALALSRRES